MLLDLKALTEPREHLERTYPASAFDATDDFAVADPVALNLDVEKVRDGYRLAGRVTTRLRVPCCRCVEPCDTSLDAAFDLRYVPQERNTGTGEAEIAEDDLSTAFYRDEQIDLGQLMREQFYLGLPMKPLCREDCCGLCSVCGANLNVAKCGCSAEWHDPRLAVLEGLLHGRTEKDQT
ncbi:MAG TPA: hypothetical protein DCP38_01885 [Acidobacteria bacterium]|jgi:uncharacterized protein|nr:hypothetical protein [Acidobacteriota bacterium]HAK54223.1 hypothetical protein [Acidobacteriota bacterium]|tara:strand:+ start:80 stop:616 length:537 start_codon:yes stop_codon:yes gene_type:complete